MSRKEADKLQKLEQIARLKADLELKKFAAFNSHVTAAQTRIDSLQIALTQCYDATAPLTLDEARMANAQAARSARQIVQAKAELARMMPRFEVARQAASRQFGRAEVLYGLAKTALRPKAGQ